MAQGSDQGPKISALKFEVLTIIIVFVCVCLDDGYHKYASLFLKPHAWQKSGSWHRAQNVIN